MTDKNILSFGACHPKRGAATPSRHPATASVRSRQAVNTAEAERRIRIAVADREGIFRLGLKRLLTGDTDLDVVAEIGEPGQLVAETDRLQPDVMFVQHEMLMTGKEVLPAMCAVAPHTKIVVTAAALEEGDAVAFIEAGAHGAILKTAEPALFLKCVHKVASGEVWLPQKHVAALARRLNAPGTRPAETLTVREKQVISCLVHEGWRNREIAQRLSITEQTVKNHLRSIYDKVGVSDRVELVLYAIHQRLVLPSVPAKDEEPA